MKRVIGAARGRAEVVRELFGFLWKRKLWWLLPIVALLVSVGFLAVLASQPTVAPFIYTLF